VLRTGRQLARFFENEPPGQPARHVLDGLLTSPQPGTGVPYFTWSPPLTALAFVALDVAVYSAQITAWFYKFNGGPGIEFRPRPIEVDPSVDVLYDRERNDTQSGDESRRPLPVPSPGTPRHPSYPSGHSVTYGAAAQLLSAFFPDLRPELDQLADNAGMARLWAGIHYRSDHEEGVELGRRVADRVIERSVTAASVCRILARHPTLASRQLRQRRQIKNGVGCACAAVKKDLLRTRSEESSVVTVKTRNPMEPR
jgi:PAP2 superfamily